MTRKKIIAEIIGLKFSEDEFDWSVSKISEFIWDYFTSENVKHTKESALEDYLEYEYRKSGKEITHNTNEYNAIVSIIEHITPEAVALTSLSNGDLMVMLNHLQNAYINNQRDKRIEWDKTAFFNYAQAKADVTEWKKRSFWTISEAIPLSFGKDPEFVNEGSLRAMRDVGKSEFKRQFFARQELLEMAIRTKEMPAEFSPSEFIKWLQNKDIPIIKELNFQQNQLVDLTNDEEIFDDKLPTNTKHKIYLILTAIVVEHYGVKIDKTLKLGKQNSGLIIGNIAQIHKDLSKYGLNVDKKSIQKYLRAAVPYAAEQLGARIPFVGQSGMNGKKVDGQEKS